MLAGLGAARKTLPAKWFYDAQGSALFEEITTLEAYYPTRQETALLQRIAPEIAARIPRDAILVELGSGASVKTRYILDAALRPTRAEYLGDQDAIAAAARAVANQANVKK